jgi:phosphoribosylformimino-5-aminoimidazole carboxamide ribotide isomerase
MLVMPAMDLMGGAVVSLRKGDPKGPSVYSTDPVEVAVKLAEAGAERLHVVDLDGALSGQRKNESALRAISEVDIDIELGGGLRNIDAIERALSLGVHAVVVGTAGPERLALIAEAAKQFPGRVCAAVDARGSEVAGTDWATGLGLEVAEVAVQLARAGVSWLEYTHVGPDGQVAQVKPSAAAEIQRMSGLAVVVAGGVRNRADIEACKQAGLHGVIVGRALYEKQVDLREALALAR